MNRISLQNYRALLLEIDLLEEERNKLISELLMPKQVCDTPLLKAGYSDPVGETAAKIADIRTLLDIKLDKLIEDRQDIELSLLSLSCEYRNILTMRYLLGYSWDQMAAKLHYSYQWIHVLHKKALKEWEQKNACAEEKRKRA